MRRPQLSVKQILQWADAFHATAKRWPRRNDGRISGSLGETWCAIDLALQRDGRGLSTRCTLAQLLQERRGARNQGCLPRLKVKQILEWADNHHHRSGLWPNSTSGQVLAVKGEKWSAIDRALMSGNRGLPGGSSIAKLLYAARGVRSVNNMPQLTEHMIVQWAEKHHQRTGSWPTRNSGALLDAPSETWYRVNTSLVQGDRGLPTGSSLAQLLKSVVGIRNRKALPQLKIEQIVMWADKYHSRHGRWPTHLSGAIPDTNGETWSGVHSALSKGQRGFPGGNSLYQVLLKHRDVPKYRPKGKLAVSA